MTHTSSIDRIRRMYKRAGLWPDATPAPAGKSDRIRRMLTGCGTTTGRWIGAPVQYKTAGWKGIVNGFDANAVLEHGKNWFGKNKHALAGGLGLGLLGGTLGGVLFGRKGGLLGFMLGMLGGTAMGMSKKRNNLGPAGVNSATAHTYSADGTAQGPNAGVGKQQTAASGSSVEKLPGTAAIDDTKAIGVMNE